MRFKAIIQRNVLVDWLETFQCVVDEARIHVNEDSLYAIPVDPANVGMVEQTLHASAFESYDATEGLIGVNLEQLQEYVEAGDAELVNITFDGERGTLNIESGSVDVEMACIDPPSIRNDGNIPDAIFEQLTTDITVDGGAFEHAVNVAGMVSDHVVIDSDDSRDPPLMVTGQGDTDTAEIGFDKSLHEGSTVDAEAVSMFSLDYLENLAGEVPSGAALRVQAGDELPVVMDYEYADGAADCRMMCAPRIQSE